MYLQRIHSLSYTTWFGFESRLQRVVRLRAGAENQQLMKQALALTGVAAAATLTIRGLTAAIPEPTMAGQRRKHHRLAAVRTHRHMWHHHLHHIRGGQVLRYQNVVNSPGWWGCVWPWLLRRQWGPNDSLLRAVNG